MKTKILILLMAFIGTFSFLKAADQMSITIDAVSVSQYTTEIRNFAVGTQLFTNRTNMPIDNIPSGFEGYKFFSYGGDGSIVVITGTITPNADGEIYAAVRSGNSSVATSMTNAGWTITTHTFTYAGGSGLVIYKKDVTAGVAVTIPEMTDFRGAIPIAKDIIIAGQEEYSMSQMAITVETTDSFEKRTLTNGAVYFTNRVYTVYDVPTLIDGFDFLASGAGTGSDGITSGGTIIPSEDGDVYVISRKVNVPTGWTLVAGSEFKYDASETSTAEMAVFKKTATAGERVAIPAIDNFQEAKPMAKMINLVKVIPPDQMSITVEVTQEDASIFTNTTFAEGATFFTNRSYTINGLPASFLNYQFLANEGAKVDKGVMIPSADGIIYLIGKPGGLTDWTLVDNSTFTYSTTTPTDLCIYQLSVKAGQRVNIPQVSDFQGVTPLAKSITLNVVSNDQEARLSDIFIDGKSLSGFSMEQSDYSVHLPYTYNQKPLIAAISVSPTATITIAETEDVRGTEDERTATITVKSYDETQEKVYKVIFSVIPEMDLYLCIGQSNMAGYAPLDSNQDMAVMDNVYLFNTSNSFEQASNPLNKYSTVAAGGATIQLGPSYSFAQAIKTRTNAPVGLIVNARGGSSIENWTKGGTGDARDTLYTPTMARALEAQKWGTFKGIIWHQGEANKNDLTTYEARLTQFVQDLRTDLGISDLYFVAGQIGRFGLNVDNFNNLIMNISNFVPNSACVSSEGLGNITGDNNHFDRDAAIELGKRYANAMAKKLFPPAEMSITVETDAGIFEKRQLATGSGILIDRPTYTITSTDLSGFESYEFLASNANASGVVDETGVMIPSVDGYLYVLADSTVTLTGWTALAGTEMKFYTNTLRVFSKYANAGEKVVIPVSTNFRGVTPIAKTINLIEIHPEGDTRLDNIVVNGASLSDFNRDLTSYNYYLPYSESVAPAITAKVHVEGATIAINNAVDINSTTESERTTEIVVTSQNGLQTATYKVIFNVLPELDLFLCIGQSNMAGAAKMIAGDETPINNAFLFNSNNSFEEARNGMNRYANVLTSSTQYYGLTYAFAKKIVEKTNKPIGLIVNARGGSSILLWEKGGTDAGDTLYAKTIDRAREAKDWGKYKAILWHQGEANRTNFESIGYMNMLSDLVANLRLDLAPEVQTFEETKPILFVAGEIGHWRTDNAPFNTLINTIEDNISFSATASAEGLVNITNLADNDSHFDRAGLITLGERYAEIVYQKIYVTTAIDVVDNDKDNVFVTGGNKCVYVNTAETSNITVTDLTGRRIHQSQIKENTTIPVYDSGVYIISIDNDSVQKKVKLFVK